MLRVDGGIWLQHADEDDEARPATTRVDTIPGTMKVAGHHAYDGPSSGITRIPRQETAGIRRRYSSNALAIRGTTLNVMAVASIAALAIIVSALSGQRVVARGRPARTRPRSIRICVYLHGGRGPEGSDRRDRAAVGELERGAGWAGRPALETLSRLRLQHEEIVKKLRLLERGRRPDSKEYRRPPFPGGGPGGPGSHASAPHSGPFQPGVGPPPPPPPDGMNDFGPGPREDFLLQLQIGDARRQYSVLNAERAALAADIVYKQVFSDDIAKRAERQLGDIERHRLKLYLRRTNSITL